MNELENAPVTNPEGVTPAEAAETAKGAESKELDTTSAIDETATVATEEPKKEEPAEETAKEPVAETKESEAAAPAEPEDEENDAEEAEESEETEVNSTRKYFEMEKPQLIEELKVIVAEKGANRHKEVNAIKQAFFAIRKKEVEEEFRRFAESNEGDGVFASEPDASEGELRDLLASFHELRTEFLAKEEQRRLDNLAKKNEILEKLRTIAADIDNINLHIPEVRTLQDEFKAITDIPSGAVTDSWKNYQLVIEQIFDCLKMNKELRDLDFKKNLEVKRDLIEQAKALRAEEDVIEAFRRLQGLHDIWRATGPVAKEYREDLWNEFKELSTEVNKRHQEFFEARKEAEKANEDAKTAICEEIEAIDIAQLKTFAEWDKTTEAIKDMQERWKALGYASRKVNNALFNRFRESCDKFFAAKAEYYTKVKEELASNLAKKIALCEKAEALQDSTDFRKTAEEIRALQAEWKTIGSVARKHSDAVWQRFLAACNKFFDARKKTLNDQKKEENDNLEAKRAVIEELKKLETESRDEAAKAIREAQDKWQAIGHVPFRLKDKIYEEFREVINALREKHDFRETRARMNNFRRKVEEIGNDDKQLSKERDRLLRAIDNKRNELQIYENNLGFLNVKSSSGNSLVKEIERRSQLIKADIAELQQKLQLLDKKDEAPAAAPVEEAKAEAPAEEAPATEEKASETAPEADEKVPETTPEADKD